MYFGIPDYYTNLATLPGCEVDGKDSSRDENGELKDLRPLGQIVQKMKTNSFFGSPDHRKYDDMPDN